MPNQIEPQGYFLYTFLGYSQLCGPYLQRVMLYPAWLGKQLAKLLLGRRDHVAGVVKQNGPRRGGALVKCKDVAHDQKDTASTPYGLASQQRQQFTLPQGSDLEHT